MATVRPTTNSGILPSISGSAPPTRSGATRSGHGTGFKTARTAGGTPLDALTQALIKKMREKFADVARTLKGQEIISQEVIIMMAKSGSLTDSDIAVLEERIRLRLAGGTPIRNTLTETKMAYVKNDEWARIYHYQVEEGKVQEKKEHTMRKSQQLQMRSTLDQQRAELEAKRKQEEEHDREFARQTQMDYEKWKAEEEAKRKLQQEIAEKLKAERDAQTRELDLRRQLADEKKRRDEAALASRTAYEEQMAMEKEELQKQAARQAGREYMFLNESNRTARIEQKVKQGEEDRMYMQKFAEVLDNMERTREEAVAKRKAIQTKQAAEAAKRPEAKTWLDPALIERYLKERNSAEEAEEKRRIQAVKDTNMKMGSDLSRQIEEQRKAKADKLKAEQDAAHAQVLAKLREAEEREARVRKAKADRNAKFREELDAQIKENTIRKVVNPMTDVEKKLNAPLLKKVEHLMATGTVSYS